MQAGRADFRRPKSCRKGSKQKTQGGDQIASFYKDAGDRERLYLYNCFEETVKDPSRLAIQFSDRHFGIGSDGVILIRPSDNADFFMDIYNADGSRAKMCGNGIRSVGKYVYERGLTDRTVFTVETLGGIKTLRLETGQGKVRSVTVDMGAPELDPKKIPANFPGKAP